MKELQAGISPVFIPSKFLVLIGGADIIVYPAGVG
jgi:hypothetical protein